MKIELLNSDYLNFVELNISGNNDLFNKCDQESVYMETAVFNLFSPCFEQSNELYDYFIPTLYNSRRIIPLQNELKKRLSEIEDINDLESFRRFASDVFLGRNFLIELESVNSDWMGNWQEFKNQLFNVNQGLIKLTDKCVIEERILWVLGY